MGDLVELIDGTEALIRWVRDEGGTGFMRELDGAETMGGTGFMRELDEPRSKT